MLVLRVIAFHEGGTCTTRADLRALAPWVLAGLAIVVVVWRLAG